MKKNSLYLPDSPILNCNNDKFQFNQIAEMLMRILEEGNLPLHIGLFGRWGSGKTSVTNILNSIKNDEFHIKTISVWKFADDAPSLHRKIVREIERVLGHAKEEGICVETTTQDNKGMGGVFSALSILFDINNKSELRSALFTILYLLTSVICLGFALARADHFFASIAFVMMLLIQNQTHSRTIQKTTKAIALQHGDQYEARFEEAVNKYLFQHENKKLIFVFDDLDRLPPTQIVAALNTIKTFLDSKCCAFIIPCDETILRQGITSVINEKMKESKIDANIFASEYLNKTFDIILRIPIVEQSNMRRYARDLLLESKIDWATNQNVFFDKVLGNLIHTGVKTPRHVKMLVNSFSFDWLLANKRDSESGRSYFTSKSVVLSVFTVLKNDFPEFFTLISENPFLLQEIKHEKYIRGNKSIQSLKSTDVEVLAAYLSRVKHEIPEDCKPYIYFSNHKLNPITGNPALAKTLEFLVNAQSEEFVASFSNLEDFYKSELLSAFLYDIDLNVKIEIENCIRVLLETKVAVPFIKPIDYVTWSQLLSDNLHILNEFDIVDVCYGLENFTDNTSIWHLYANSLELNSRYQELVKTWINNPQYAEKLSIQSFSNKIQEQYLNDNEGYVLSEVLLDINSDRLDIIKRFDWTKILISSLKNNNAPNFTFVKWLDSYRIKVEPISCGLINNILENYNFIDHKALDGVGELWCKVYRENPDEKHLESLMQFIEKGDDFGGFEDPDYKELGKILIERSKEDNTLREVVLRALNASWGNSKEFVCSLINNWHGVPGVLEFCGVNFLEDLDDKFKKPLINCLLSASSEFDGMNSFIEVINNGINRATNEQRSYQQLAYFKEICAYSFWKDQFNSYITTWFLQYPNHIWLNWSVAVVKDRAEIFCLIYDESESQIEWFFGCLKSLVEAANGVNRGHAYYGNARQYINIIFTSFIYTNKTTQINKIIDQIATIDLIAHLDTRNRDIILSLLAGKVPLDNHIFNNMLVKYSTLLNETHQNIIIGRWEYLDPEDSKTYIANIANASSADINSFVNIFVKSVSSNSPSKIIVQLGTWEIDTLYLEAICKKIIDSIPSDRLTNLINEFLDYCNKEGKDHWRMFALSYALDSRNDYEMPMSQVIETSLGLQDERAELALALLVNGKFSKNETKKYKEKVILLNEDYPDLVNKFKEKFRFRLSKLLPK